MRLGWCADGGRLRYRGDLVELEAVTDVGWVRLAVGGREFLRAPQGSAAMVFRRGEAFVSRFSDAGLTVTERNVLRVGDVRDGVYLQQFHCLDPSPRLRLNVGFNDARDHDLLLLLNDGVRLVRVGPAEDHAAAMRAVAPSGSVDAARVEGEAAILVHEGGAWLRVTGPLWTGTVTLPDGERRGCVGLPCRGFAANTFEFTYGAGDFAGHWLAGVRFDVTGGPPLPEGEREPTGGAGMPVYAPGDAVRMGLRGQWLGPAAFDGTAEIEIVHMDGRLHALHRQPVRLDPATPATVLDFAPDLHLGGPSDVWGRVFDAAGRLLWADRFRMVYDIEGYEPEDTRRDDHDAFWARTLEEMRSRSLDLREERRFGNEQWEFVELSFNVLGERRVHAMLFLPRNLPRPLPVVITAHPNTLGWGLSEQGGVYGSKVTRDGRFAWFVPLIRGHRPDAEFVPFNVPWWGPLGDRETYEGRYWFSTMARSVDALAELGGEIDLRRIVAKGGSQGGALALVTAALDDRVCCCLADCPSHGELARALRPGPLTRSYRSRVPEGMAPADLERMLSYFDPVNHCPSVRCPTVIGHNVGDTTVHIGGGLAMYKRLTALPADRKWFCPGAGTSHANSAPGSRKMREWMDAVANGWGTGTGDL